MITDWKALFCLVLFSKRKSCFVCFHSSPVSLNICFQGVELLSAIPPKTFCSPVPAPSTEMTFSEVSSDLSQAKAKTQRCTLLFTRHDSSCHLFISMTVVFYCSHGSCERCSLSSSWLEVSTSLWSCYCHVPFWLPPLCSCLKNLSLIRWSPKVGLILPDFIQIQETLLHLSY